MMKTDTDGVQARSIGGKDGYLRTTLCRWTHQRAIPKSRYKLYKPVRLFGVLRQIDELACS